MYVFFRVAIEFYVFSYQYFLYYFFILLFSWKALLYVNYCGEKWATDGFNPRTESPLVWFSNPIFENSKVALEI
jgi:hypothetical protein